MKKRAYLPQRALTWRAGLKSSLAGFLFLLGLSLTSCEDHNCEPSQPVSGCNTFATVEDDGCRSGYLGGKWFRLDNGDLLMPQASSVAIPNLEHGQRVKLSFATLQKNPTPTLTCNYVQAPEEPDFGVQITCLELLGICGTPPNGANCDVLVTAENVMCGNGVWENTWLKLDDGTYLQPWESAVNVSQLTPGQRYRIGFEKVTRDSRYDQGVTCQAVPPPSDAVRITCLEPDNYSGNTVNK